MLFDVLVGNLSCCLHFVASTSVLLQGGRHLSQDLPCVGTVLKVFRIWHMYCFVLI